MTDGRTTATVTINNVSYTPDAGDVVLADDTHQEYVWIETDSTNHTGYWELLGDEGSYVLQTSQQTISIGSASITSVGALPSLTTSSVTVPNVSNAGSASNAQVVGGVLQLTNSVPPTIESTPISFNAVATNGWSAGALPVVSVTPTDVIAPATA